MGRPNYLALEPLLMERLAPLSVDWPGLRLATSADLGELREVSGGLPALWVLYLGDRNIPGDQGEGTLIAVDQAWCVAVAVRDLRTAGESRAAAGELIAAVLGRVQGWQPPQDTSGTYGRLLRTAAPAPIVGKCVMITPLYFTCRVKSRGAL
jgi:hypothetical protein